MPSQPLIMIEPDLESCSLPVSNSIMISKSNLNTRGVMQALLKVAI